MSAGRAVAVLFAGAVAASACGSSVSVKRDSSKAAELPATLAQVYYWKARPGMLDEYNRYITRVAEPIDAEARKRGAFISVTTYQTRDTLSPWTHMRVFMLRDSAQLWALSAQLDSAGARAEPDAAKRLVRDEYAGKLRERVGSAVLQVVRESKP